MAGLTNYLLNNIEAKVNFSETYDNFMSIDLDNNMPHMTESLAVYMKGIVTPLS